MLKPSITITQNISAGYDTEYQPHGESAYGLNELLSSQLAVTTKTLLTITVPNIPYEFIKVSTLGDEQYPHRKRAQGIAYQRIL